MNKRFLLSLLLMAVLILTACGPAKPATHYGTIKANGKIVVGTSADFAPFESVDANGNLVGFDIDLIREIGKQLNLQVEIQDMPFDSLLASVEGGKVDVVIAGMNYTAERAQKVLFTDPYFTSQTVLIVRADFNLPLSTSEDIAKYKVGTQTGTTADSWITENLITPGKMPASNLFHYDRPEQGALDLQSGRIDAYAIDSVPASQIVSKMTGLKIIMLNEASLTAKPMNIVVPLGDTELAQAINKVLADLKANGYLDQLDKMYITGQ